ncbi:MAG TPA: endonuclease/exonuclease/phosphatase family protein, partial [Leifsonia sp.]|nr:endonuclease/exonuclease/phosphatase family protein [Leifsonia sp.]
MPILRSSRPRGVVTGILGLGAGALLVWHGMLPNVGGSASLIETFLPWVGVVILALGIVSVVRLSLFGGLCVAAAAVAWGLAFMPALLPAIRAGTPSLTVASENVSAGNPAAASIARDLAARAPDVIALQELDATSRQAVAAELHAQYPHSEIVGTVGVWSKYAITDEKGL